VSGCARPNAAGKIAAGGGCENGGQVASTTQATANASHDQRGMQAATDWWSGGAARRLRLDRRDEAVARLRNRLDVARFARVVAERAAQCCDVARQQVLVHVHAAPDVAQQRLARHDRTGFAHQALEQRAEAARQALARVAAHQLEAARIPGPVADAQYTGRHGVASGRCHFAVARRPARHLHGPAGGRYPQYR
jgi:hypothetical protein